MHLQDFDFALPTEFIAQTPAAQRDHSRLMVVLRDQQRILHDRFYNIGNYLRPNDILVVNDTRVIPARLRGRKRSTGGTVEVLLLHELQTGIWEVLLRPAARVAPGGVVEFGDGLLCGTAGARQPGGTRVLTFTPPDIYPLLERCGEVPLPPYIRRPDSSRNSQFDQQRYQTVFARHRGAVAAPTAGLHFTSGLLAELQGRGIDWTTVTLHVGWGTFKPIRTEQIAQHRMDREFYQLPATSAEAIGRARSRSGRVVAVGTTVTRALESIGHETGGLVARSGWAELFIYPGYRFQSIDALVTNFHLPRSSLFLLVCAFAGHELMRQAYRQAVAEEYRFYSYGDAMLIL